MRIGPVLNLIKTSGTVQDQVQRIRERHGGINLAVFKIGITHCLELRVLHYYDLNFDEMCCIHASQSLAQIEALEASLIDSFSSEAPQCRNILPGGEGMRMRDGQPRHSPPYFVYVVAANASQMKRIGG